MKGLFISLLIVFFFSNYLYAVAPLKRLDVPKDAEIVSVRAESDVLFVKAKDWYPAVINQVLTAGDTLKTGIYGRLDVLFKTGIQIKVNQKTTLIIKETAKDKKGITLGLKSGEVWSRSKAIPDDLKIETPSATAAIRGTDWNLTVDEKGSSYLTVLNGFVEFFNDFGTVRLTAGEQAMAEVGKAPVKLFLIRPKDRVQWIISYQPDFTSIIVFHSQNKDDVLKILPIFKDKVKSNPDDIVSTLSLAGAFYDIKETDESMKLFDEVLKRDRFNIKASLYKGLILLSRNEVDKAVPFLEIGIGSSQAIDKIFSLIGMAEVYLYKGDITRAEKIINSLSQIGESPVIGLALAKFRAYQGDFTTAIKICLDYAKRYPDDERFYTLAGDFYLTMDEPDKALENINKALSINKNSSNSYLILGRYNHLLGLGKESERAFQKAVDIDNKNADAFSELGKLMMEKGNYERALQEHNKAIGLKPNISNYLSRRGMLLNWIDDIKGAYRDYKKATELNPSDYQSINGLGFLALKEGKTDESIYYFNKSSLLEPRFSEPHIFLAIAYYQQEDIVKALEELRLAKSLDPKDPIPYMIAYLIYQDTYRPFDAIREATRALELLPNLKSVNPIESNQKGTTNLGNALLGLGLTEWGTSYAEDSFNQYDAGSYYFSAIKYEGNAYIYASTMTQAFLLDPLSIKYSDRYQDIIPRPQNNLTVNTTLGSEGGGFYRKSKIIQQGYLRKPFQISYLLDWENLDNRGFRENGYTRSNFITYGLGAKPDYKNGFFIWGGFKWLTKGETGSVYEPDSDDTSKDKHTLFSAGYNYRVGEKNNILLNFFYNGFKTRFYNNDPLGSTGLPDYAISFVDRFGLNDARRFFSKGIYDLGIWNDYQTFASDSTGTLLSGGFKPLAFPSTANFDINTTRYRYSKSENLGYQFKHLFTFLDNHDFSYGMEYIPINMIKSQQINSVMHTGNYLLFYDEIMRVDPTLYAMRDLIYKDTFEDWRYDSKILLAYLNDRWRITDSLLMEYGLSYEWFRSSNSISNDPFRYGKVHPRFGISWSINNIHTIRTAYQKKLYPGASQSLAPLSTVGLIFDWIQVIPGSIITDYQASFESRWNERLFSSINIEKRDVKNSQNVAGEKNSTNFISAGINTILTNTIGAFMRYKYADSEVKDGQFRGKKLPFLPRHAFGGGLVWVSPAYLKSMLSTYYISGLYGNEDNSYRLPDSWTTDLTVTWEPMKKHLMLRLDAKNIFNSNYEIKKGYPAVGRSMYLTAEYRF